jgi:hypothetical protein
VNDAPSKHLILLDATAISAQRGGVGRYVEELARELGCGDGLLALATEIATAAHCRTIEGNALPGDRETKNLYERASMKARKIVTARDL